MDGPVCFVLCPVLYIVVNVQVELLELLAEVDYKFIDYLESVGLSSAFTTNHRFLGVR